VVLTRARAAAEWLAFYKGQRSIGEAVTRGVTASVNGLHHSRVS
jgi:hypothetical protein